MNNECCENNIEEKNCCCDCHENDCDKTRKEMLMQIKEYDFALTINFPCNKWRWLEEPWPWERGIM